jgi:hypothetical protein
VQPARVKTIQIVGRQRDDRVCAEAEDSRRA